MLHLERGNEFELEGRVMVYTPFKNERFKEKDICFYCFSTRFPQDLVEIFDIPLDYLENYESNYNPDSVFNISSFTDMLDLVKSQKGDLIRVPDSFSRDAAFSYLNFTLSLYWTKYFEDKNHRKEGLKQINRLIGGSSKLNSSYIELTQKSFFDNSSLSRYVFNNFLAPVYSKNIEKLPGPHLKKMREFFKGTPFLVEVDKIENLVLNCDGNSLHLVEKHLDLIEALSNEDYELARNLRLKIFEIESKNH